MRAKVSDWRGLCLRTSAKWADFVAQSLHWKLPFPTQVRDWFDDWVVGSQFDIYFQTADLRAGSKDAVSVGIFAGIIPLVRSPVTLAVSQADFSLPSLHPKIPFPAAGFSTARSRRLPGILGGWAGAKGDVSNPVSNYWGFNPRASNCRLHSAGASRNR